MAQYADARSRHDRNRRSHRHSGRFGAFGFPLLVFLLATAAAIAYIAYILWPRWPETPVTLDAPTLPITVASETFNIEPAAIRQPIQRRPGTLARVDLAYLWPTLTPPGPELTVGPATPVNPNDRLFMTIATSDDSLPPLERMKTIYPRYLVNTATDGPGGLALRAFRDDTAYRGEDFVYDPDVPEHFFARCTRNGVGSTGMCLYERRIGDATVTIRFPRDWLNSNWQDVAHGLDRLVSRLHPDGKS